MCTVTYLPLDNGCLITSNRDEIITRAPAIPPASYEHSGKSLIYPKDPQAGGSWIASSRIASVCLFNGAFEAHKHEPPYRHSRGLIPIQVLVHDSLTAFAGTYDLQGIEPFSIVEFLGGQLHELKWDGSQSHLIEHDPSQPHIWASATLYSAEVRAQRQTWFEEWLDTKPDFTRENILHFHTQETNDLENGLLIQRASGLRTVSVTSMHHHNSDAPQIYYRDLITRNETIEALNPG